MKLMEKTLSALCISTVNDLKQMSQVALDHLRRIAKARSHHYIVRDLGDLNEANGENVICTVSTVPFILLFFF